MPVPAYMFCSWTEYLDEVAIEDMLATKAIVALVLKSCANYFLTAGAFTPRVPSDSLVLTYVSYRYFLC
jgi:hypothetical protein